MDGAMKFYNVTTDDFITDRCQIIERLVTMAGSVLTFSQRNGPGPDVVPAESKALLRRAAGRDGRERWAVEMLVRDFWRSQVLT